jgi:hypothetical protein
MTALLQGEVRELEQAMAANTATIDRLPEGIARP